MEAHFKRPISVWIAQIVFVYFVLMAVLAFFVVMMKTSPSERSFVGFFVTSITNVIFIVLCVTAFWGMAARKSWGRWLGVGLLSFMLIFANISKILFPGDNPELVVGLVFRILYSVLVFIVIMHISLSDRVAAFFPRKISMTPLEHPPPPPTFDD